MGRPWVSGPWVPPGFALLDQSARRISATRRWRFAAGAKSLSPAQRVPSRADPDHMICTCVTPLGKSGTSISPVSARDDAGRSGVTSSAKEWRHVVIPLESDYCVDVVAGGRC